MTLTHGETIKAGTVVLITSGEYSDYGVNGLYRAVTDVVIPGKDEPYGRRGDKVADIHLLSTLLEELPYEEGVGRLRMSDQGGIRD